MAILVSERFMESRVHCASLPLLKATYLLPRLENSSERKLPLRVGDYAGNHRFLPGSEDLQTQ